MARQYWVVYKTGCENLTRICSFSQKGLPGYTVGRISQALGPGSIDQLYGSLYWGLVAWVLAPWMGIPGSNSRSSRQDYHRIFLSAAGSGAAPSQPRRYQQLPTEKVPWRIRRDRVPAPVAADLGALWLSRTETIPAARSAEPHGCVGPLQAR